MLDAHVEVEYGSIHRGDGVFDEFASGEILQRISFVFVRVIVSVRIGLTLALYFEEREMNRF
jgi:hypothetical protein